MIMAALGNALGRDVLRDAFATRDVERATRPAVAVEEFNVRAARLHDHRHRRAPTGCAGRAATT